MDIKGILTDIVSTWNKEARIDLGTYGDKIVVLLDVGRYGYILDKSDFIFDVKTLKRDPDFNDGMYFNFEKIARTLNECVDATLTNDFKSVDKNAIRRVAISNGCEAWIPDKQLKRFNPRYTKFKAYNGLSPIFIYEESELVGVIMPVRVENESRNSDI